MSKQHPPCGSGVFAASLKWVATDEPCFRLALGVTLSSAAVSTSSSSPGMKLLLSEQLLGLGKEESVMIADVVGIRVYCDIPHVLSCDLYFKTDRHLQNGVSTSNTMADFHQFFILDSS